MRAQAPPTDADPRLPERHSLGRALSQFRAMMPEASVVRTLQSLVHLQTGI